MALLSTVNLISFNVALLFNTVASCCERLLQPSDIRPSRASGVRRVSVEGLFSRWQSASGALAAASPTSGAVSRASSRLSHVLLLSAKKDKAAAPRGSVARLSAVSCEDPLFVPTAGAALLTEGGATAPLGTHEPQQELQHEEGEHGGEEVGEGSGLVSQQVPVLQQLMQLATAEGAELAQHVVGEEGPGYEVVWEAVHRSMPLEQQQRQECQLAGERGTAPTTSTVPLWHARSAPAALVSLIQQNPSKGQAAQEVEAPEGLSVKQRVQLFSGKVNRMAKEVEREQLLRARRASVNRCKSWD